MVLLDRTMPDQRHRAEEVLVQPRWLSEHLDDPELRIIEVDVSPVAYDQGHIRGALLWNIYRDLKDSNYQLVAEPTIQSLVRHSGIAPGTTVVFYGYAPAMGFWPMKLYGHADVRILDCSPDTWQGAGLPWNPDVVTAPTTAYRLPDQDRRIRAQLSTVQDAIEDPSCTILDVRSDPEFRGERFWPSGGLEPGGRPGHVPSAVSVPTEGLLDADGAFRNTDDLRTHFASLPLSQSGEVIPYCTIGARACTAWFVLTYLLDRQNVCVYDGSWAQWGRTPGMPVESA